MSESSEDSSHESKKRKRPKWYVNSYINQEEKLMTINVVGDVKQKMADAIFKALDKGVEENVEKVVFYITSPGGHSDAGYAIYNQIKVYKKAFTMVAVGIGELASSAIDILLACDERYCTSDCEILVHGISYSSKNVEKLWNERMIEVFAKRTKKKRKYWHDRMLTGDHHYTAEEAQSIGLIDKVIDLV